MRFSVNVLIFVASLLTGSLARSIGRPGHHPHKCTNADSRLCWDGKYDINTNYYNSGPRTGRTVSYYIELKNATLELDGIETDFLTINGTVPGPTLFANWGDTIEVKVKNLMKDNGTSIHWHGIRQLHNNINDGVNGVTECPLAPEDTKVYRFVAEQYGTTWYHSHYGVQYGDGAWGAIQINGPATAEYDIDLGAITLSEIYNQSAWLTALQDEQPRPRPVPARNILINGTNANFQDPLLGKRFQTTFTPKMKHRLRFINTAADTVFQVSLDSHNMTVIQSDFVPVHPYTTSSISIAIGQRYDVIIEANQPTASYWLRAVPQDNCGERNDNRAEQNVTGFIAYEGSTGLPIQSGELPPTNTRCEDETRLVPYLPITVQKTRFMHDKDVLELPVSGPVNVTFDGVHNVTRWKINNQAIDVDWSYPTLQQLHDHNRTKPSNPIFLDDSDWTYWIIENTFPAPHPIHLHGHDFNVIASGFNATFDPKGAVFNWKNPIRRDTATLPGGGYLAIAFKLDNPGVWLLHCHIAWHVSEGLSLQLIERQREIFRHTTLDRAWQKTCRNFDKWYPTSLYYPKNDSGL